MFVYSCGISMRVIGFILLSLGFDSVLSLSLFFNSILLSLLFSFIFLLFLVSSGIFIVSYFVTLFGMLGIFVFNFILSCMLSQKIDNRLHPL